MLDSKSLVGALALTAAFVLPANAQQTLTGYTGDVKIQGIVSGANTATVRAYVNGLKVAEAETGVTGDFTVSFQLDGALDQTAVVWFIPDDSNKVPEIVVLKESSAARRNGVWSPCLTRLRPSDVIIHNVTFLTQADLFATLEESDCWAQ